MRETQKERKEDAGWEKNREEKEKEKERKGKGKAKKERRKRKKERKERKERRREGGMVDHVAGGGRRRPETAGSGRRRVAKALSPTNGGASVVEMVKMEF